MADAMENDANDFNPWSVERREALLDAGDVLAQAVRAHTRAFASAASVEDFPNTFPAADELLAAAKAYAEAQFNFSGNAYPLGILHSLEEEGAEDDEDADESDVPVTGITILQRIDYAVVDEAALLAAGRAAYRASIPGALASAALGEVKTVGQAIHQIAETHGWPALAEVDGLDPVGGTTLVHRQTELLSDDPDEWPEEIFAIEGELIYGQRDVYLPG